VNIIIYSKLLLFFKPVFRESRHFKLVENQCSSNNVMVKKKFCLRLEAEIDFIYTEYI